MPASRRLCKAHRVATRLPNPGRPCHACLAAPGPTLPRRDAPSQPQEDHAVPAMPLQSGSFRDLTIRACRCQTCTADTVHKA